MKFDRECFRYGRIGHFKKEEGRGIFTENVFAMDASVTSEQIPEPKLTSKEGPEICTQREKCWKL